LIGLELILLGLYSDFECLIGVIIEFSTIELRYLPELFNSLPALRNGELINSGLSPLFLLIRLVVRSDGRELRTLFYIESPYTTEKGSSLIISKDSESGLEIS